jgi:putative endonuclease
MFDWTESFFMSRFTRKLLRKLTLSRPATRIYDHFYPTETLGERGERAAERFLLSQGMVIIARGVQDKFGEIDLIAVDDETIVFVEVKTRSSDLAGLPAEAVDETKQQHLTKTAQGYLKWNRLTDCRARFDVVGIIWLSEDQEPQIKHYENAFEPVGQFQMF